jgi:hypothetical protein
MSYQENLTQLTDQYFPELSETNRRITVVNQRFEENALKRRSFIKTIPFNDLPPRIEQLIQIAGTEGKIDGDLQLRLKPSSDESIRDEIDLSWMPHQLEDISKMKITYQYWLQTYKRNDESFTQMYIRSFDKKNHQIYSIDDKRNSMTRARAELLNTLGKDTRMWRFRLELAEELASIF